jgi:hypothetical protein
VLSSARTARMKLVKNDAGTIANGVWTLNYLWSGMQSNSSRQRSTVSPPLQHESSLRPKHSAALSAEAKVPHANKLVPV